MPDLFFTLRPTNFYHMVLNPYPVLSGKHPCFADKETKALQCG